MDLATRILCANNGTFMFYLGQAGYILKSKSGQLLGVDLYLSDCVERVEGHIGFKRMLPKILSPFDIKLDCIIATHPHLDHFDMDSIPELMANGSTQLYSSVECRTLTNKLDMLQDNIHYVKPGDSAKAGDFSIEFVDCDHGKGAPDAFGVVITVDGRKIYMAGDTCLRLDRVDDMKQRGPFDIVIGPINGAYGNMNEKEFAVYSTSIGAKTIIPCHYGMFASHGGNPGLFLEEMDNLQRKSSVYIMTMGEQISI